MIKRVNKFYGLREDLRLPEWLDDHQRAGIRWALSRKNSYLAHAPGAGKTCQAIIAALNVKGDGQAVFIVPPSLTLNWARECRKFFSMFFGKENKKYFPSVAIIPESNKSELTDWFAEFLIVPDSMITRAWVREGLASTDIKFLAVDEASRFKESTAKRTIALFGGEFQTGEPVPGFAKRSKHVVLLDGSPMPNRSMELWAPTYALTPESIDFMNQVQFGFKYCGARMGNYGKWEFKGDSNQEVLRAKLRYSFMHFVGEESLSHPERRRSIVYMSEDVRSPEQKSWEKENLGSFKFSDLSEDLSLGDLARFRNELGLRKVPWAIERTASLCEEKNESILLFAWHKDVCKKLYTGLQSYGFEIVNGETKMKEREKIFSAFQNGKLRGIVGNISAMGRGNNLQKTDRVIFAEYSWTDETNKQAEKRASRRGSEKDFVRCEYIVCPNSMDEPVAKGLFRKAENIRRVIG